MTFNPSNPLNSDSPGIFPAQNQTNMSRLQTLLGADHQFNLTATANDGYHNLVHLTPQAPAGALPGYGRGYVKTSASRLHQFYMDETGQEYQITPTLPIRAAVNFNGLGGAVIRSAYNIASVTKIATGLYEIVFTDPMPDANYIVNATAMRNASDRLAIACVSGNTTYSDSVTTAFVRVTCYNNSGDAQDMFMVNVMVFSIS